MEKDKNKIVLSGTYEGSYKKFRGSKKKNNQTINIIDMLLNKLKKLSKQGPVAQ